MNLLTAIRPATAKIMDHEFSDIVSNTDPNEVTLFFRDSPKTPYLSNYNRCTLRGEGSDSVRCIISVSNRVFVEEEYLEFNALPRRYTDAGTARWPEELPHINLLRTMVRFRYYQSEAFRLNVGNSIADAWKQNKTFKITNFALKRNADTVSRLNYTYIVLQLRSLLAKGALTEARRYLANALLSIPVTQEIDNYRKILAPPKVSIKDKATGGDAQKDFQWIKANSSRYKNKWVALKHGQFLGSNKSRLELRKKLQDSDMLENVLFFRCSN